MDEKTKLEGTWVNGKYVLTNDELTVSNIQGRYSDFNRTWINIK